METWRTSSRMVEGPRASCHAVPRSREAAGCRSRYGDMWLKSLWLMTHLSTRHSPQGIAPAIVPGLEVRTAILGIRTGTIHHARPTAAFEVTPWISDMLLARCDL